MGKKDDKILFFWRSFWALFGGLLLFLDACQEPKHCNVQRVCAFGMGEELLATC